MDTHEAKADQGAAPDPMDRLGHLLIRAYNGDDLDPYFVKGHPNLESTATRVIRSCFYYSVVMTPKVTALFDNDGRGGMCTLDPHELSGLWKSPDLLAAGGVGGGGDLVGHHGSLGLDLGGLLADLLAEGGLLARQEAPEH